MLKKTRVNLKGLKVDSRELSKIRIISDLV
jgi:hypothetical protein